MVLHTTAARWCSRGVARAIAWQPRLLNLSFPSFGLLNAYARAGFVPSRVFVYHVRSVAYTWVHRCDQHSD